MRCITTELRRYYIMRKLPLQIRTGINQVIKKVPLEQPVFLRESWLNFFTIANKIPSFSRSGIIINLSPWLQNYLLWQNEAPY